MKNYLLLSLCCILGNVAWCFSSEFGTKPDCDTLTTVSGKVYLCKIESRTAHEIQFKICGDHSGQLYKIAPANVARIGLSQSRTGQNTKIPEPSLDKQANTLIIRSIMGILLTNMFVFSPFFIFLGISTFIKARRLMKQAGVEGKLTRKLKRKLRWAKVLGLVSAAFALGVFIWIMAVYVIPFLTHPMDLGFEWGKGGGCFLCEWP